MTAQTGRTHSKWLTVKITDSGGTLRDISAYVNNVGQFGMTYDTQDVTAFSDAVKNIVVGQPGAPITLGGPIDTTLHGYMTGLNGTGTVITLDLQMGIRHAWEAGEPQFGITRASSSNSGYTVFGYTVDPGANTWSASLDMCGATAPAWSTVAETSGA